MSFILSAGGTSNSVNMTAAGTIAAGQPCIVTAAGTAAQVGVSGGGTTLTVANTLTGPGAGYAGAVFVDTPKAIVSFGNTRRNFVAGSYGVNGVTWGTPVNALVNSPLVNVSFKALPNSSVFLIFYAANGTNFPTLLACSVSGTTITVGTPVTVEAAAYANFSPSIAPINATTFALMWTNGAAAATSFNSCAGTVSGTTITLGSTTNTPTINVGNTSSAFKLVAQWDPNASRVVFMWGTFGGTQYFEYQTASISGTTLTYAAAANLYSGAGSGPVSGVDSSIYDTQRNQIVLITESTTLRSLSVAGAVVTSVATATGSGSLAYDSVDNLIIMNGANSNTVTNSGAALTVNANTTSINSSASICYDASTNTIFGPGGTVLGAAKLGTTNLGTGNYVGIATNAASVGGTVTINTIGNTATIAGLTPGSNYAVQSIGGLSPVASLTLGQYAGVAISNTTLLLKG